MGIRGRVGMVWLAAALPAIVGAVGWYVEDVHRTQRASLQENFEDRARLTAELTGGAINGTSIEEVAEMEELFGGAPAGLAARLTAYDRRYGIRAGAIVDGGGRILASDPPGLTLDDLRGLRREDLRAEAPNRNRIGDMATPAQGVDGELFVATSYRARDGVRALVSATPVAEVASFAGSYLAGAPAVPGARAVLVDGRGRVLSGDAEPGGAAPRFDSGWQIARAPVAATRWHVVFAAPKAALFAPAEGAGRRLSLALFLALALTLLAAVLLARRVVRRTREAAEARTLAHERLHDPLTGLPNRSLFLDRVAQAMGRRRSGLAVMFVDLDRFKRVNDSLGHLAGDEVIRAAAVRLRAACGPGDTVCRFGGDEFLVLSEVGGEADALSAGRALQEALESPLEIHGRELKLTACVGVALLRAGDTSRPAEEMVRDADAALFRAKREGAARTVLFDEALNRRALERLDVEVGLAHAVERDELVVHYQPMVDARTGHIRTLEALVRWNRDGRGLVAPGDFIPVAEDSGLIVELGDWVLRTACTDLARLRDAGAVHEDVRVSVNLSPVQLMDPRLIGGVRSALDDAGLPARCLWLEVTEGAVMHDLEQAVATLEELKALGVTLAMDDFGKGQSSLSHVARLLPIDVLKLDRSFGSGLEHPRERAIVAAVAALGGGLGLVTVAEGVESAAAASEVARLGCDLAQGFHWYRPVPLGNLRAALLAEAAALAGPVSR